MEKSKLNSTNPSNGDVVSQFSYHTSNDVLRIISLTDQSQREWGKSSIEVRAELVRKVANILSRQNDKYSRLITLEMGKPVLQSKAEVEKCAGVCEYYAENAGTFLANESVSTEARESYIAFRPLGVVLAIMPWNFPFWQVFRFAAPALMAGNGILLKHASNVTGSALAIEELFREAGLPENIFRTLKISSVDVGRVIENPVISAVTITGSVQAGSAVAARAGGALKKTVLELGGSDPYIILDDADLESAVPVCVEGRLINGGQSCIAAKRFIVVRSRLAEFEQRFVAGMSSKKMGDPLDEQNDLGPQASVNLRDELHNQVLESIRKGARCLLGAKVPDNKGAWYPPTVLTNVKPGMPAYDEEIFGPVAAIIQANDEIDAVRIANDTKFGLGAAVFTSDIEKGRHIAENLLNAGCCFVNDLVRSDPRLPFGGTGDSGYGRELSHFGIREFVNIKTVYVK
jgi:succinate-semialdehyde dehydrogenase / glutarate-semialdehyde dehydrogenase